MIPGPLREVTQKLPGIVDEIQIFERLLGLGPGDDAIMFLPEISQYQPIGWSEGTARCFKRAGLLGRKFEPLIAGRARGVEGLFFRRINIQGPLFNAGFFLASPGRRRNALSGQSLHRRGDILRKPGKKGQKIISPRFSMEGSPLRCEVPIPCSCATGRTGKGTAGEFGLQALGKCWFLHGRDRLKNVA